MNTVKNLNVNRKAKALRKKRKLKPSVKVIGSTIIASAVLASIILGGGKIIEREKTKPDIVISQYYGEDSTEDHVVEYINISEKINKLNLNTFNITDNLYEKYNISNDLKTPKEINNMIDDFTKINAYISSKDIVKQSNNIELVLNLKKQERLINRYIYEFGYQTANENIEKATQKYAAEVFGIEDYSNLDFDYIVDYSSGDRDVRISNIYKNEFEMLDEDSYTTIGITKNKEEKNILSGASYIESTNKYNDTNILDNYSYNNDRNRIIKEALLKSIELEKQVEEKDLYNEKMANKLK